MVGAPLEDEDEEGGWRSELLRRLRTGSTALDFLEMVRKKRVLADLFVACVCSVFVVEAAVEAASDLSDRLEAKTAAMRRMGRTSAAGGRVLGRQ